MKFLFDLFPVLCFFAVYWLTDIYVATVAAIVATFGQVAWLRLRRKRIEPMLWVSLALIDGSRLDDCELVSAGHGRATLWLFINGADVFVPVAKVTDAWQAEERRKLADAKVKAALEKANADTGFEALAKELGLEMRTAKPVTRFEADQGNYLTQPVVQELFKLQPGKTQSVRTAEGSVLVRLKQIEPVDLAKDKDAIDRFGKQLDSMVANDLILQLIAAMRTKYGVVVDEATFVAAFRPQNQP